MPTIIDYNILTFSSKSSIITAVHNQISEGWQPLGSVVKYQGSDYYQTMVKYAPPKPNSI